MPLHSRQRQILERTLLFRERTLEVELSAILLVLTILLAWPPSALSHSQAFQPSSTIRPAPGLRAGEEAYSVAMHMHSSWSEGDGSYEWHTSKAQAAGVDVIWWSEHDWRMTHEQYTTKHDFENSVYEAQYLRWAEPDEAFPGEFRYWLIYGTPLVLYQTKIDSTDSFEGQKCFSIVADDPQSLPTFRSISYQQEGSNKQGKYSLTSRVKIHFAFKPVLFDTTSARFVLETSLSIHPQFTHKLRYVLGSMEGEGAHSIPLPFTPGEWNEYTVDVTRDAIQHFTSGLADSVIGEDNALSTVRISFDVRNNFTGHILFDDFRYIVDTTMTTQDFVDKQREFGDYYEGQVPSVRHLQGTEVSKFRAQPHMNAFTPMPFQVDYGSHIWSDTLYYAVDQVHAVGGAISLNHPFGTGIYGNLSETPAQKAQRVINKKIELLATKAYRTDILEVGYRWRGGIVLADHLKMWDTLTSHGLYVTANGVSDSHGTQPFHGWAPWTPSAFYENNFATWLLSTDLSETAFIDALLAGRAYFGDPYNFDGVLDLSTTEGIPMGRVALTDKPSHTVVFAATGVPDTLVNLRIVQGEIRPNTPPTQYLDVNWLRDETHFPAVVGGAIADTVTFDTSLPSFIRAELTGPGGKIYAFSNPLSLIREFPATGIPAPRVAGSLGPLTIQRARNFTWKTANYDTVTTRLFLGGDETEAGEGEIVIECASLGPPAFVLGAATSTFDSGILTLGGFAGAGSAIEAWWGAVGVDATVPAIHEVALGPGRPNPFRKSGLTCEFAMPRSGPVTLRVVDVTGRAVRTLVSGVVDAGIHRAAWDGLDTKGRDAANGVYFLRLEAGGKVLSSKAVKTR